MGVCQFELVFADGYTYSGQVEFVEHGQSGCGCPAYLAPAQGTFQVDNPSSNCKDAQAED